MPGFDGTGPVGVGPMTGGGRGFCAVPIGSRWATRRVTGIGRGRGRGRGLWRNMPCYEFAYGYPPRVPYARQTAEDEIGYLKAQAEDLKNDLRQIEARIEQLDKNKA